MLLAVGSLAAWTIYQGQQVAADKARFAQAERDIDDLSKQVVASVGAPVKTDSEKYCSRPNTELNDGPLSCSVYWNGYYEVDSALSATQIFVKITSLLKVQAQLSDLKSSNNLNSTENFKELEQNNYLHLRDYQRIYGKIVLKNSMDCNAANVLYKATEPPYSDFYRESTSKYLLAIHIGCDGYAKTEHYPMKS